MSEEPRHEGRRCRERKRIMLVTSVVLVLVVLVSGGCGGGREPSVSFSPSWSPDGRAIAYVVDPDPSAGCPYASCTSRFELWVMGAGGGNARKLARGVVGRPPPIWSPDGRTIAFEHVPQHIAGSDVYTIRRDGTHLRRLTRTPWEEDTPAGWSPDGNKLVFVHWPLKTASTHLYVTDADGSGQRRLTHLEPSEASWSPDGTTIAVTTFDGLFAVGADGRGPRKLFSTPQGAIGGIGWSPDGQRIAFGVEGRFAVVDVGGRVLVPPEQGGYGWDANYELHASWSPDGQAVAYERPAGGIDLVRGNGSEWRRLAMCGKDPAWSPDGARIAFSDGGDIYVMNSDGTGRRKLSGRLSASRRASGC